MAFTEFVRVRDLSTGHEYDVAASAVDPKAHEVLKDYPPNLTGLPRPAKHRTTKAAQPATTARPKRAATKKATAPAAKTKEK